MTTRKTKEERFWNKVDKASVHGCWLWQGAKGQSGYGNVRWGDKFTTAHRVAWEIARAPIPDGMWVLHRCDNRLCVNPAHLFLGTPKDNTEDRVKKGRRSGGSKLSPKDVREIRAARAQGAPYAELQRKYGVCKNTIYNVASGRHHKAVKEVEAAVLDLTPFKERWEYKTGGELFELVSEIERLRNKLKHK